MTRDEIDAEFYKFFEFPTTDRSGVSSVSARLFARHIAEMVAAKQKERELEREENE